jgi:homoserine O-acetyltransferase/O-succinyltransferase
MKVPAACLAFFLFAFQASAQDLQFAELGSCPLEKGGAIEDCRLGYRTYGQLNAGRSNAILFPTWFTGTSRSLADFVGSPGALLDTTRFFVILVDAFGNGVSSSPSNSTAQPGDSFPAFTIRDMVDAEYRLVKDHLQLSSLYAVAGISMGGMQAYQWAASYPDFVGKIVSMAGTPRVTPFDVLQWITQVGGSPDAGDVNPPPRRTNPDQPPPARRGSQGNSREGSPDDGTPRRSSDPDDWYSQVQAMLNHDIYAPLDRLEDIQDLVTANVLAVVNEQDPLVSSGPSKQFAQFMGAELLTLDVGCGHQIFSCAGDEVQAVVSAFLNE